HDQVRHIVLDLANHEDHPLLQETRVDVISPLAACGLFDHHRDQTASGLNVRNLHKRIAGHVPTILPCHASKDTSQHEGWLVSVHSNVLKIRLLAELPQA